MKEIAKTQKSKPNFSQRFWRGDGGGMEDA